jgi:hypothetical protein
MTAALLLLWVVGAAGQTAGQTPTTLRTFVTDGGMSVTYPAALIALITSEAQTLLLRSIDPNNRLSARVVGDADAATALGLVSISSPESILDAYYAQIASLGGSVQGETVEQTLANGRALSQSYTTGAGTVYFVAFETDDNHYVFIEVTYDNYAGAVPTLDSEAVQVWLDIAAAIQFDQPPTRVPEEDDSAELQTLDLPRGALLPAQMPEGFGILSGDLIFPIPEGWTFATEGTFSNGIVLLNEDMMMAATMTIHSTDIDNYATFEDWRDVNHIYFGLSMTDSEGNPIVPTMLEREDGRRAERYVSPEMQGVLIYTYYIDVGRGQFVWIINSMLADDEEKVAEQVADSDRIALEITRFNRNSPIETVTATCDLVITLEEGESVLYECPAGCTTGGSVWGTDIYTGDSAVCPAAVHAGIFSAETGGEVVASYAPGQDSYESTTRNGITTNAYGSWGNSFTLSLPPAR